MKSCDIEPENYGIVRQDDDDHHFQTTLLLPVGMLSTIML